MGKAGTSHLAAAALLGAAVLASCVLPDDVARIQKDVADVRDEVARLRSEQQSAKEEMRRLEEKLGAVDTVDRSDFADTKLKVDDLSRQIAALDDRIARTEQRMDRVGQDVLANREASKRLTPPPAPATASEAPPVVPVPPEGAAPNPEDLYSQAYADFSKGNFALAVAGFEEYASRYPDSDTADNALYWIGECAFSQGRYDEALRAYDRMLEKYPRSDKAAAANLKKGLALLEKNEVQKAIVQLQYVAETYPASDEARIARDRLKALGR